MTSQEGRQAGAEVYDLGYQHYQGPREGRARARRSLYVNGLRTTLGIGRGPLAKVLAVLMFAAAMVPAVVMAVIVSLFGATFGINGRTLLASAAVRDVALGTGVADAERARLAFRRGPASPDRATTGPFAACIRRDGLRRRYYRAGADVGVDEPAPDAANLTARFAARPLNASTLVCLDGRGGSDEKLDALLEAADPRTADGAQAQQWTVARDQLQIRNHSRFLGHPAPALGVALGLPRDFLAQDLPFNATDPGGVSGELVCHVTRRDVTDGGPRITKLEPSSVYDDNEYNVKCIINLLSGRQVHLREASLHCDGQRCTIIAPHRVKPLEAHGKGAVSIRDVRAASINMMSAWSGPQLVPGPLEIYDSWWINSLKIIGTDLRIGEEKRVDQTTLELYSVVTLLFWLVLCLLSMIFRLSYGRVLRLNTVNGLSKMLQQETNPLAVGGRRGRYVRIGIADSDHSMEHVGPLREEGSDDVECGDDDPYRGEEKDSIDGQSSEPEGKVKEKSAIGSRGMARTYLQKLLHCMTIKTNR